MTPQIDIIGEHPKNPNLFERWFASNDISPVPSRCHRSLTAKIPSDDPELISWLAQKVIDHHYSPNKLKRLKRKYKEIGFPQYAKQHRQTPNLSNTRKGNATEIVLIEYIVDCQPNRELVKYYKFRYNPNVDQSMKGDDALLIDFIDDEPGSEEIKVFLGEAKFRSRPDKPVLDEISASLGKDKLPLSFTFLVDRLSEDPKMGAVAELLENFIMEEVKAKGNMRFVGMLLSNANVANFVENKFTCDNRQMVIISAGLDNPKLLIDEVFKEVKNLVANPDSL